MAVTILKQHKEKPKLNAKTRSKLIRYHHISENIDLQPYIFPLLLVRVIQINASCFCASMIVYQHGEKSGIIDEQFRFFFAVPALSVDQKKIIQRLISCLDLC